MVETKPSIGKAIYYVIVYSLAEFPSLDIGSIVYVNPNYPGDWPEPDRGLKEVPA